MTANREPSNQSFEIDREATVCTASRRFLPLWGERQRERTARRLPANFRSERASDQCPLWVRSGHQFGLEGNGPGTLCVMMGRLHITPDVDAISFTPQAIARFADAPEPWL